KPVPNLIRPGRGRSKSRSPILSPPDVNANSCFCARTEVAQKRKSKRSEQKDKILEPIYCKPPEDCQQVRRISRTPPFSVWLEGESGERLPMWGVGNSVFLAMDSSCHKVTKIRSRTKKAFVGTFGSWCLIGEILLPL